MRAACLLFLPAATLLMVAPASADYPTVSTGSPVAQAADVRGAAKPAQAKSVPARSAQAETPSVPAEERLNPRWKVRSWTISGLTVWTFRPGHFVRD